MKQHPATKYKGRYPEIQISSAPQNEFIGKRSGLVIKNDARTGLDFLLNENFTVKSNCTTLGKKTQAFPLQESCEDSSSSSSSSSDSDSQSLSVLSTEKEAKSSHKEQDSFNSSFSSHLNEVQFNLKQCAEDLMCPTNYDNEGSKVLDISKVSKSCSQQNDSSICSLPKFKTKEEIERKYKLNEGESEVLTIQGLSSIQKSSNSIDNSIMEETNIIQAALDEPKRRIQLNKTIYEEAEEEVTKNYPSQTVDKEKKEQQNDNQLLVKRKYTLKSGNENDDNDDDDISQNIISPLLDFSNNYAINNTGKSLKSIDNQPTKGKLFKEKAQKRKEKVLTKRKEKESVKKLISKKKKVPEKKQLISETQYLKQSYQMMTQFKSKTFDVSQCPDNLTFGINNRYSLRTRVPKLNHLMGEKIKYIRTEYGDEISQIISCRIHYINYQNSFQLIENNAKLYKPLQELKEGCEEKRDGNAIALVIKPHCKKQETKNDKMQMICEIKESQSNNWFIIDNKVYKNQKPGKRLIIPRGSLYEIRNYSNYELALCLYNNK